MKNKSLMIGVKSVLCVAVVSSLCSCQQVNELFSDSPAKYEYAPGGRPTMRHVDMTYHSAQNASAASKEASSYRGVRETTPADQANTKVIVPPQKVSGTAVPTQGPVVGQ